MNPNNMGNEKCSMTKKPKGFVQWRRHGPKIAVRWNGEGKKYIQRAWGLELGRQEIEA